MEWSKEKHVCSPFEVLLRRDVVQTYQRQEVWVNTKKSDELDKRKKKIVYPDKN